MAQFPLDWELVSIVYSSSCSSQEKQNPFINGIPEDAWRRGFLHRCPCLTGRKPQYLPRNRAEAASPKVMKAWFEIGNSLLYQHEINQLPDLVVYGIVMRLLHIYFIQKRSWQEKDQGQYMNVEVEIVKIT